MSGQSRIVVAAVVCLFAATSLSGQGFLRSLRPSVVVPGSGGGGAECTHPCTIDSTQRAIYDQMVIDYNGGAPTTWGGEWLAHVINQATYAEWDIIADAGLGSDSTFDIGEVAALAYQITGNAAYATEAYSRLTDTATLDTSGWGTNELRDVYPRVLFAYDWLYDWMDATQRTAVRAYAKELLDRHMDFIDPWIIPNLAIYQTDSDVAVEMFFGFQLHQLVIGDEDAAAMAIFADTAYTWGSLTATGCNFVSLRNALCYHLTHGIGGEWFESSAYNMGTVPSIMRGIHAIRTIRGTDDFPEVDGDYFTNIAKSRLSQIGPDLTNMLFWGDNEDGRYVVNELTKVHSTTLGMLEAVGVAADATTAQQLQDLVLTLHDTYNMTAAVGGQNFNARAAYLYNPYVTRGDYTTADRGFFSSGNGHTAYKSGYSTTTDSQILIAWNAYPTGYTDRADHGLAGAFGSFELLRKGNWEIRHPRGYGVFSIGPTNTNAMSFEGLVGNIVNSGGSDVALGSNTESIFFEYRKVRAHEFGSDYAYVTGTQGGSRTEAPSTGVYLLEPAWLNEHSRSVLYLPGADKTTDCVVIYDYTNVEDPEALSFSGHTYPWHGMNAYQQSQIEATKRRTLTFHMSGSPTNAAGSITSTTAGGNTQKIFTLLPATQTKTTITEASDPRFTETSSGDPIQSELAYSVEITETSGDNQTVPFLNVQCVYETGITVTATLIDDAEGIQGVLLSRTGEDDVVALFNSAAASDLSSPTVVSTDYYAYNSANQTILDNARWRTTDFSVSFTTTTTNSRIFAFDLKQSLTWTYDIGGGSTAMGESSAGVAVIALTSSGAKTFAADVP